VAITEQFGAALKELDAALGELDKAVESADMDAVTALKPTLGLVYGKLVVIQRNMENGGGEQAPGLSAERHGGTGTISHS
jgi:hypothetical protein